MTTPGPTARRPIRAAATAAWVACLCSLVCGAGEAGPASATTKPRGSRGWKDTLSGIASEITLSAEKGTLFYGFDTLAIPGRKAKLVARLTYVKEFRDVEGATVEFLLGKTLLGSVRTDDEGFAKIAWTPPKVGDYEITAKIKAVPEKDLKEVLEVSPASLLVCARTRETKFVVIDLDHTVVASSFFRVLVGGAKPMDNAAEVVKELTRTYSVIYLTHRPDLLGSKSKRWLSENGFPRAPLLVSTLKQSIGSSRKYKAARLRQLRKRFPNLAIGIGDRLSDAEAYVANGMKAYLIPDYDRDDDDDLRDLAEDLRKFTHEVQVVDNWEQIRAGIFKNQRFGPKAYARKLLARAKALEEEKKRRKKREHDDD